MQDQIGLKSSPFSTRTAFWRRTTEKLIAVGYSNGANIAASLILLHPHYLVAAVLFQVMVPFTPEIIRDFRNLPVFIGAGDRDPIVPRSQPKELGETFESGGANVTLFWDRGGHELGDDEIEAAKTWLSEVKSRKRAEASIQA